MPAMFSVILVLTRGDGMKKYRKFAALIVVVLGALIWLASAGINETKTYYKTISEVGQMGDRAYDERLRVAGDVEAGSIQHTSGRVDFMLVQDKLRLKVAYSGSEPLPDTFRDGAQALADGKMGRDGVFHASKIQAKCASKYEAKPGQLRRAPAPINKTT
jgi:cytochrome c-type biogenesis protein CcmE